MSDSQFSQREPRYIGPHTVEYILCVTQVKLKMWTRTYCLDFLAPKKLVEAHREN